MQKYTEKTLVKRVYGAPRILSLWFFQLIIGFQYIKQVRLLVLSLLFPEMLIIFAHGLMRFWPFLCPQAIKKGDRQSYVAYYLGGSGKPWHYKHELVHALKRKLSAFLFSCRKFTRFPKREQERKALNYTLLFIYQSLLFNYLFRPFGRFVYVFVFVLPAKIHFFR